MVALLVCATAVVTIFYIKSKRSASHDLSTTSAMVMSGVFEDPRAANYDSVEPPDDATYAGIAEDEGVPSALFVCVRGTLSKRMCCHNLASFIHQERCVRGVACTAASLNVLAPLCCFSAS